MSTMSTLVRRGERGCRLGGGATRRLDEGTGPEGGYRQAAALLLLPEKLIRLSDYTSRAHVRFMLLWMNTDERLRYTYGGGGWR